MPIRRRTFAAALPLLALMAVPATAASEVPAGYPDQKVVYQNDGGAPGNATYFKHILGNMKNHIEAVATQAGI